MTPEDVRYFDKQFKEVRENIQKLERAVGILLTRTTPKLGE
ncbi:hypothetical protein [Nitrososphaeria virus YSH_1032793]|uniref:Uncharacterized protein n=1 Tax=Nitrososphaeria virus YSH_1032793 TaxID=3071320 RepID=A0A976YF20_9CAUD|nr:hypothetical protein QKV91_gp13 [Yangshan Harbor Nitrososphaeria virus]UVF62217.1 hypothetical protein [Nitrososphaeria virus YSH_1032793]